MKTPKDMASLITKERYWMSPDKITLLFELLFSLSLRKEEGRYPEFQIFIPLKNKDLPFPAIEFYKPQELDLTNLHRISPGIPKRPYALCCYENDNGIFTNGIFQIEYSGFIISDNKDHEYNISESYPSLVIRIDGPGHLIIRDFTKEGVFKYYEYKHGEITEVFDFSTSALTLLLATNICNNLKNRFKVPDSFTPMVRGCLSELVAKIYELSHGSSLLFVPQVELTDELISNLDIYINTNGPDFGNLIFDFMCNRDLKIQTFIDKWKMTVETVSNLSKMDGALIFNSEFKLIGIRTMITSEKLPDETIMNSIIPNSFAFQPKSVFNISDFGTRHRSVITFCNRIENSYGIVVSEDKEIRIITKKESSINVCGPLKILPGLSAC